MRLREKATKCMDSVKVRAGYIATVAGVAMAQAQTALATTTTLTDKPANDAKMESGGIVAASIDMIMSVFPWIGAFFVVAGVFKLIMAYRSDNPEGQSGAAKDIVIGALFIGFKVAWSVALKGLLFKGAGTP